MLQGVCVEVLLVTILLWVSLFGIVDVLVSQLDEISHRLMAYGCIGGVVLLFSYSSSTINACTMM